MPNKKIHCECGRLLTETYLCVGCCKHYLECTCKVIQESSYVNQVQDRYEQAGKAMSEKTNQAFADAFQGKITRSDVGDKTEPTAYLLFSARQTFETALKILESKNHDYASLEDPFKNFKASLAIGIEPTESIYSRFLDKVSRMSNFILHQDFRVKDENFEDTLLDAINYLAILNAWLKMEGNSQKEDADRQ